MIFIGFHRKGAQIIPLTVFLGLVHDHVGGAAGMMNHIGGIGGASGIGFPGGIDIVLLAGGNSGVPGG